jgi:hypothetical protein
MTDYLEHLAARALGLADVVRPRLIGLFEPLDPSDTVVAAEPFEVQEIERPSGRAMPPDPRPVPERSVARRQETPRPAAEARRLQVDDRGRAPPASSTRSERQPSEPERAAPPAETAAPPRESDSPAVTAADVETPPARQAAAVPAPSPASSTPGRPPSWPGPRPPAISQDPPTVAASPRRTAGGPPRSAPQSRVESPSPPRPPSALAPPNGPEPRRGERDASSPAPTAPTIRVTIGRVDVRALAQPAPRPAAPRRASAIALNEYLKQRRERRR